MFSAREAPVHRKRTASYLLREAGLKDGAKWVIAEGADGGSHIRSLPLNKLLDDAILALYQNGERLRPSQGYPMRLFVPGWEGNVNIKWVHRLEVTDTPAYSKDESGLYAEVLKNDAIERFSITVFPDGRSLPVGQGSVRQGRHLYAERCALCHGEDGIEGPAARLAGSDGFFSLSDPLRILRINQYPLLVLSVGAQWPYATSVFDYTWA